MQELFDLIFPALPTSATLAFTGSGGKSSLIFSLARTISAKRLQAIITTTTHMWNPEITHPGLDSFALIITDKPASALPAFHGKPLFLASGLSADQTKMNGYSPEALAFPLPRKTFLLIESDGSAQKPLKAHADHEPVCPIADATIAVAGLSVLGKPLTEEYVHRHLMACKRLSLVPGTIIQPSHIISLLSSSLGPLKNASGKFYFFLNQVTPENQPAAEEIAAKLPYPCIFSPIIG